MWPAAKFKVKLLIVIHFSDYLIAQYTANRKQHTHSDVIVKQYNIMSTQVVSWAVTSRVRGKWQILRIAVN